jgi:hypothetical protein
MRLPRPHIPVEVKCRVALRQLGTMWIDDLIQAHRCDKTVAPKYQRGLGAYLVELLDKLAALLNCQPGDLHLDHVPALALRDKLIKNGEHVGYMPDANDPEHLLYRERHEHHIKTQVRGDGAQFPDRVLIKRARRRERPRPKRRHKWASRPLRSANRWPKRLK